MRIIKCCICKNTLKEHELTISGVFPIYRIELTVRNINTFGKRYDWDFCKDCYDKFYETFLSKID